MMVLVLKKRKSRIWPTIIRILVVLKVFLLPRSETLQLSCFQDASLCACDINIYDFFSYSCTHLQHNATDKGDALFTKMTAFDPVAQVWLTGPVSLGRGAVDTTSGLFTTPAMSRVRTHTHTRPRDGAHTSISPGHAATTGFNASEIKLFFFFLLLPRL